MTRWNKVLQMVTLACSVVVAGGCRGRAVTPPAASGDETPDPPARSGEIAIDSKMLASIKVDAISDGGATSMLTVAGRVQFDEDRVARVLAPLSGQVVDLRVRVGDPVRKGQTICALSSRDAAVAAGEHIESRKDLELAEKNAVMTHDLFEHEAASKMALQQAENDLAKARARVARTEEALHVLGLAAQDDVAQFNGRVPILAPIAGVVIERRVTDGQFAPADGTPLMTVANLDTVWVIGDLFERDLRLVGRGQPATVTTGAYPGIRFEGRVNYISEAIDPASRTAKVRVSVANPGGRLKPEMYTVVALAVATDGQRALKAPADAIFTEDGRSFVYVELSAGHFARRAVEVAPGEGPDRRILTGLRPGDRIVVDGALLLRQEEQQRAS
jgi:cobalt-zinc-cadmium efflux system membrane fusion protein